MHKSLHVRRKILKLFLIFMIINLVGATFLFGIENLNFTDSFYLCMSATTTTGFGNVAANTTAGKWFISFYSLVGICVLFYGISLLAVHDESE